MNKSILPIIMVITFFYAEGRDCNGKSCCPTSNTPNPVKNLATNCCSAGNKKVEAKDLIKEAYGNVARESSLTCPKGGCCGGGSDLSKSIGYTEQELQMFADANLGLGCGNPVSLGYINEGDVVLDLGSGAGLDCFLASRKVGRAGRVIGVDMTCEMIEKARSNAQKYKINNVEFRMGDIEALPVESKTVDVIISNCVINLAPSKQKVFNEAYRVLKSKGKMVISDVVLLKNLSEQQKNDVRLLCACVSGAMLKNDYINLLKRIGFEVTIIEEDKEINRKWFDSEELPIASLKFVAQKK